MVVKPVYNRLRPYLPRKWGVMGGVAVRDFALFDRTDYQPEYQAGLIDAIRSAVREGDCVVDIAAGRGVAAVWAHRAGASCVLSYEASAEYVGIARQTAEANAAEGSVEIIHGLVAHAVGVWGQVGGAERIPVADLPKCDVLQLDCEGAELAILEALYQRPRVIIVETHPRHGAPTQVAADKLVSMGYDVDRREYRPSRPEKDVLVATGGER